MRRRNPNPARHHEWYNAPNGETYELIDLPQGQVIILMPNAEDVASAIPQDCNRCALALCASRQANGVPAEIGREFAKIPRIKDGCVVMCRCKVSAPTRRDIARFDATGEFPEGGFLFTGIPPSQSLDSQRSADKRRRDRWGDTRGGTGQKREQPLRNASRRAQVFVRGAER